MELRGPETVDLTPSMREEILLNLPAHPHCDRDGDRVCQAKQVTAVVEFLRAYNKARIHPALVVLAARQGRRSRCVQIVEALGHAAEPYGLRDPSTRRRETGR